MLFTLTFNIFYHYFQMYKILILMLSIASSVEGQNWIGIFSVENGCDQQQCCCLLGPVTLKNTDSTKLQIESRIAGRYCPSSSLAVAIAHPTGFSTYYPFLDDQVQLTLSADSNTITAQSSLLAQCRGRAVRSGSCHFSASNYLTWFLMVFSLIIKTDRLFSRPNKY